MKPDELSFAARLTAAEGWQSETLAEFQAFHRRDPDGCLIARLDGSPAGIAIATRYGDCGFIGELIVLPEQRGRGLGGALLHAAIEFLVSSGSHSIYLDGVVEAVSLYERNGFHKLCRSLRFSGRIIGHTHPQIRPVLPADLPAIHDLDRHAFGADRSFFLDRRLQSYSALCWLYEIRGVVQGFILGRRSPGLVMAGPWVVRPGWQPAAVPLLQRLALAAGIVPDGEVRLGLGVLETNSVAVNALRELGLEQRPDPPWRMLRGSDPTLGASEQCWAVGSAAKG